MTTGPSSGIGETTEKWLAATNKPTKGNAIMNKRHAVTLTFVLVTLASMSTAFAANLPGADKTPAKQLKITRQDERDTRTDLSQYFTGSALVNPLFSAEDDSNATAAQVAFDPGARTNWHIHPVGQQLIVTHGVGRVQIEGQPVRTIHSGDVVWIPAGTNHWHGADRDHSMTHIAIQERRDGENVEWGDAVSDAQYTAE